MRRFIAVTAGLIALAGMAACGSDDPDASSAEAEPVTLTVFAAASLTETFEEIGNEFEKANEGVTVEFSFAGSSDLVTQIQQGAPADVFASADENNMKKATDDDLTATTPEIFVTNTLTIAVPPDNPADVKGLDDLADDDVDVVVCAPEVPCGAAATRVEDAAGIDISPVSEEQSVTDVLNKVSTGEADAGLVYVTDVKGSDEKVTAIDFPESSEAVNSYPIASLADSKNGDAAQELVDYVLGEVGQKVLTDAGFGQP